MTDPARYPRLQGDVLIVDDSPANLQVLTGLLKDAGHRVRPVSSGEMALRAARHRAPEIVLLDANLPGISGYEVCRQLKEDPNLADIPVLFISGLTEAEDKLKAFAVGSVDFVTKPFQLEEVKARVETQLRLRRMHRELDQRRRTLEEANRRLMELQSLRDGLVHMIVHDLRSPLTGVVTALHFLRTEAAADMSEASREDLEQAIRSSGRLMAMINDLLDINRMESRQLPLTKNRVEAKELVESSLDLIGRARCSQLEIELSGEPLYLECDRGLSERILYNLVDNALKYASGSQICLRALSEGDEIVLLVSDSGPGIPVEAQELIFEKFGQLRARREHGIASSGLGLAFCKLAAEAQGGSIGVESEVGRGSTFWVRLPRGEAPSSARSQKVAP